MRRGDRRKVGVGLGLVRRASVAGGPALIGRNAGIGQHGAVGRPDALLDRVRHEHALLGGHKGLHVLGRHVVPFLGALVVHVRGVLVARVLEAVLVVVSPLVLDLGELVAELGVDLEALGLAVGQPWDHATQSRVEHSFLVDRARRDALILLADGVAERHLEQKLKAQDHNPEAVTDAIQHLHADGWLTSSPFLGSDSGSDL